MNRSWMGINETYAYYRIRHAGGEERVLVAGERGIRTSCRRLLKVGVSCNIHDDEGNFLFSLKNPMAFACKPNR